MSPAEHANLCTIEAKMLFAPICTFNSLVRSYEFPCYETFSRFKPASPLSNYVSHKHYKVHVSRSLSKRPPTPLHGLLMHEQSHSPMPSMSALSRDKEDSDDAVGCIECDSLLDNFCLDVITNESCHFGKEQTNSTERCQSVEEPWLLETHVLSRSSGKDIYTRNESMKGNEAFKSLRIASEPGSSPKYMKSESIIENENVNHLLYSTASWCSLERELPVEDPWLFCPTEPLNTTMHTASIIEPIRDAKSFVDLQEQRHQVSEKLISGTDSNVITQGISLSTEILINCSVCTMQRIAVLEDGNLVELLLEPVKCNVQCDSVYLGVVTKLVPHMGGAFVNIGSSRPSLMDINSKREPFIFPPFSTVKESDLNDSSSSIVEQTVLNKDDPRLYDDDPDVDFEEDDFGGQEREDNIVLANQLNGNGSHAKLQSDLCLSQTQGHRNTRSIQGANEMWALVRNGTKIVVQVVKEGLGTKGPTLTAYPKLRSRFWILITHCNSIGVSKKISGVERTRLRVIAKSLQPPGFGVTVRTVAAGHSVEELHKDLEGLLLTWRNIMEHAKSASLAADEGVEGAVPVILHQAMAQTLSVVQDYFNEKVKRMVVDSPRTYNEVTNYLLGIAPDLCERVELHRKKVPLFDEFNIEEEINNILNKRVALPNGGSLVIEQTEALVSIDVNGGHGMFGQGASQEKAVLDVNLAAAKQIARELRLRDIGGIIVVDFIDMMDDSNKRLIYEEVNKAVERDRSMVKVSELSKHGLMEITRKRVRPSVTFLISEPCTCCHGTGRIEALETSFSKIEHEICSLLATMKCKADPESPKSWPRLLLRVDTYMCDYLTSGKKTKLATLSSSLKVWILLKVARSLTRGGFELKVLSDEKSYNNHQVGATALPSEAEISKTPTRAKLFTVKKWKAGRRG